MENIAEFFNKFDTDILVKHLISIVIFFIFYLLSNYISYFIIRLFKIKIKDKKKIKKNPFYGPLSNFIKVLGIYIGIYLLKFPDNIFSIVTKTFEVITIILVSIGFANSVRKDAPFFVNLQKKLNMKSDSNIVSIFSKVAKFLIYLVAGVIIIGALGYDINGFIAGLGLGSLTIALAAQDAAKNLFGGVVILVDKPFSVGDWIETSTFEGVVEDISFRSTRIRTFEDSLVTVPNSTLSNDLITNWSKMNKRRIDFYITLSYTNSLKKIADAINKIKIMLEIDPTVDSSNIFVNLNEITDNGYKLMIYFYTRELKYRRYLLKKEQINYKILQILEKENIDIAYDTSTVYLKK